MYIYIHTLKMKTIQNFLLQNTVCQKTGPVEAVEM